MAGPALYVKSIDCTTVVEENFTGNLVFGTDRVAIWIRLCSQPLLNEPKQPGEKKELDDIFHDIEV